MIGAINFNGKFRGIPISAKQIDDTLIEINVDNNLIQFKKGGSARVIKLLQTIINNRLNENAGEQRKTNSSIKKFVASLDLEFKNIKNMPVKKVNTKKKVAVKKTAPKKKVAVKKIGLKKKVAIKKTSPKKKVNISYEDDLGKYLDSQRPALPLGKRISKEGNVYYENRLNHADAKQTKKRGQMLGVRANRSNKGVLLGIKNNLNTKEHTLNEYKRNSGLLEYYYNEISEIKELMKLPEQKECKKEYLDIIKFYKKIIPETKTHLRELKKFL